MKEKLKKAKFTPEVLVKTYKGLLKVLEERDGPAITVEARFAGEKYDAVLDMNAVKIDSYEVSDQIWENIRQCNISTETLLALATAAETYLIENGTCEYRIPIPIGLKPIKTGTTFSLDLRIIEKGLEDACV